MPAPVADEVAMISGCAAGRFRIAAAVSATTLASASGRSLSHLVSTTWYDTAALSSTSSASRSLAFRPWRASTST